MNNYKKLKVLGKGAFGEVYKVKSLKDGNEYALKSVKINNIGSLNELDLLRRLEHPNLLHAVDFWVDKSTETLKLVLPLADSTLFEFLNNNKNIDTDFKIKWMYELLSVVHFLHKSGYSHCDLKPENIFLVNNKIMLADFSLAYPLGTDMFACGTYVYTSPQANEKYLHNVASHYPEAAEKMDVIVTDIYMLGIIFICIFGNVDFPRMQRNMTHEQFIMGLYGMSTVDAELTKFLNGMRVPIEWQPLIKGMIAVSQNYRYQSTDQVLLYEEFKSRHYHEPIRGRIIRDGCSTPYVCGGGQVTEDNLKEIFENMLLYASDNSIKIFVDSIYIFYRVLGHLKFTDKQKAKGYGYASLYIASLCNLGNVALDSFFNFTPQDMFDKVIEIIELLDGRLMCTTIFDLALSKDELIEGLKLVTNCSWKKSAEEYHYEYIRNEEDHIRIYRESKYILCNDITADEIL